MGRFRLLLKNSFKERLWSLGLMLLLFSVKKISQDCWCRPTLLTSTFCLINASFLLRPFDIKNQG
jgi:hypothetical protein